MISSAIKSAIGGDKRKAHKIANEVGLTFDSIQDLQNFEVDAFSCIDMNSLFHILDLLNIEFTEIFPGVKPIPGDANQYLIEKVESMDKPREKIEEEVGWDFWDNLKAKRLIIDYPLEIIVAIASYFNEAWEPIAINLYLSRKK